MGVLNNLEPHTKDLLDAISDDDIMIYMYENKLISHQAVKKYFKIKDICELPDMSYWTKIDLEDDLGISDDDILDEMWDDDIYQYLEDHGFVDEIVNRKDMRSEISHILRLHDKRRKI